MTVRLTTGVFKQEFRFALPNRLLAENKGTIKQKSLEIFTEAVRVLNRI